MDYDSTSLRIFGFVESSISPSSSDFCSKFAPSFALSHIEHLDLSNNHLEDKGINALSSSLSQRKFPLRSIYLQSCSISQKSLYSFHTGLTTNSIILKNLQILNLTGNRIKEENCLTLLFSNPDNVLEEFHLSDVEFSLEAVGHRVIDHRAIPSSFLSPSSFFIRWQHSLANFVDFTFIQRNPPVHLRLVVE